MPKNFRINQQITAEKVHLIDEKGQSQGIVSLDQALLIAHQRGYDLVEVASTNPPVCRLLDFGKYKYQLEKEEKKSKQKQLELKEVRLRLSIEPHDLETKINKIKQFLEKGHKTRITLILRGREMAFLNKAYEFLNQIQANLAPKTQLEKGPEKMGNRISIILVKKR